MEGRAPRALFPHTGVVASGISACPIRLALLIPFDVPQFPQHVKCSGELREPAHVWGRSIREICGSSVVRGKSYSLFRHRVGLTCTAQTAIMIFLFFS